MRQLYCNDSMFNSLGAFYSVISSTQGGWTWLSSEGRYMGAAAWGDMNRASNPYYARLKEVLHFGERWRSPAQPRAGQLVLRPVRPSLQGRADRHPRRAAEARPALESRRGAARRGHPSPARHQGSPRQGRGNATGVRGCHDPCRGSSPAHDRREPAGADRRRGAERGRQHAAARTFRRGVVCEGPAAQGPPASVGAADARRSRRHHRRGLAVRASRRRPARRADDACVLLRSAAVVSRTSQRRSRPTISPRSRSAISRPPKAATPLPI